MDSNARLFRYTSLHYMVGSPASWATGVCERESECVRVCGSSCCRVDTIHLESKRRNCQKIMAVRSGREDRKKVRRLKESSS